jgi:hypothetical protein
MFRYLFDCFVADMEAAAESGQCFALLSAASNLSDLVVIKLG